MTELEFIKIARDNGSIVSQDRLAVVYRECMKTTGEVWECGVYKGGSAKALSSLGRVTRLFDTFIGMPDSSDKDNYHKRGDFGDISYDDTINNLKAPNVHIYPGFIPNTFAGLENKKIGFAHVDVDIYQSILDCCKFITPRLKVGGIIIFDDYGLPSCAGVKIACDEYYGDQIEPLPLKQARFIKTA